MARLTRTRNRATSKETGEFSRRPFGPVNWVKIWRTSRTLVILHLPPPPSASLLFPQRSARQLCYQTFAPPFLLGMHVITEEVVTSMECGRAIGRKFTDVTGMSLYMRSYATPPWTPCCLDRGNHPSSFLAVRGGAQ